MPYRGANHSEVKFVGTGSTYFVTNDYIVIDALENDISSNTSGTIAFWMKPDDGQPSGTAGMVSLSDTSAEEYIYIQLLATGIVLAACNDATTVQWSVDTDAAVWSNDESTWKHIALVQDGVSPVLYVDGIAVAQAFSVTTNKTTWMNALTGVDNGRIGSILKGGDAQGSFFSGSMKNVGVWSRALTATEIQNVMYKTYDELSGRLVSNLVSWYSFEVGQYRFYRN